MVWLLHRSDDITDYVHAREQARTSAEQNEALREHADRVEADLFARTRELEQLVADLARATARAERSAEREQEAHRGERAAAARTAQVTESMAVGYLSMDADWVITYVNTEAVHALGRPREELVGGVIWELFPGTVGTDFEAGYRRAATTGEQVVFDAYYPEPLNAWYEVRATPEADGVALYFINITERRQAQAAIEQASAQVSALGRFALALTEADSIDDLTLLMAEQGHAALGADGGAVAVPDPDDPAQLRSYISASLGQVTRAQYSQMPMTAVLPVTQAVRTATRVLVHDHAEGAAYSAEMAQVDAVTGCQAWVCLPLMAQGHLMGVLSIGWREPQRFEAEQLELLNSFAAQCSQALQRLAAREAERASAQQARLSAQQARLSAERALLSAQRQSALVQIAQSLSAADSEGDVLDVLGKQGAALLDADGSGLCLLEPDAQHVRVLASESFDADLRAVVQRIPADFPMPIVHAAVTGAVHLLPDLPTTAGAFPGATPLYTAAGVQASACLPLRGRSGLLGSISLAFTQARHFTGEEEELLAAFAALIAQAVERIAAHTAEQVALAAAAGIAETLQRSMLTPPPEPDHLQVLVRYAAAADHAEVGGDWYDAFITADGHTSLVIGDVTGHDMAAAATMGQMRNLVRGIAFTLDQSPAAVLSAVDRAVIGLGVGTITTAVLAQVEQDAAHKAAGTRLLRWSNAGHPPPLLIGADGQTQWLDPDPDLVLGWEPGIARHDHEVTLQPGTTVLLYTDGLVERRGAGLQAGMEWLAGAVRDLVVRPARSCGPAGEVTQDLTEGVALAELCDGLLALVDGFLDDDVALVALRAHPEDRPRPPEAGPGHVPAGLDAAQRAAPSVSSS